MLKIMQILILYRKPNRPFLEMVFLEMASTYVKHNL